MRDAAAMTFLLRLAGFALGATFALASCSSENIQPTPEELLKQRGRDQNGVPETSLLDALRGVGDSGVKVNRYLWTASLDVLDFLPVQSADPFTGVISTGYGTPPGGGRAYRATVLISDPALDARALNLALQTRGGPVSAGTQRAVEDAILARARQLRIQAGRY